MKQFDGGWFFILFICSFYVHANDGLDVIDCSLRESTSCDVFFKMERNVNEVSYKVELVDAENERNIFPYFDMNETTENVTLQKHGDKYVFLKSYLDSTKAMEFITFKYDNKTLSPVKYYYIESFVDFNNNVKKWSGKECDTSIGRIPEKKIAYYYRLLQGYVLIKLNWHTSQMNMWEMISYFICHKLLMVLKNNSSL